ncbi:hypothetical protein BC943DRAFT_326316 [Umbelopsis sp. AD052]|nr:hypothetical protein BC943DRAFT_326316 [Umbelopsis sp. AD052]
MSPTRRTSPEPYDDIPSSPEPKRKQGGRHRLFSNEQRKDRNRLAQAAFRERRSQYTKTLECTIENLETIICELQDSNRATSQQLDDTKEESNKMRQLLLTVITENHNLRRKIKSMNTTQKDQVVQYASRQLPCSPVLSMTEDTSDSLSVSSENSNTVDNSFLQFLMGLPPSSAPLTSATQPSQGEFLSFYFHSCSSSFKEHSILVVIC